MLSQSSPHQIRLNKFIAERLGISRREADSLIAAGRVFVDDKKATLGERITDEQKVKVDNKLVSCENEYVYIAMNKPKGYVCSRKKQGEAPTIYDLLPEEYRTLKTVGRLDKDSSGLILFTNDGDFAYRMTHPKFTKTKVYWVELDHELEPLHQQEIADFGVDLSDGVSKFELTRLREEDRFGFEVVMHEGKNRQIRRTFAALGYEVKKLHRVDFGKYQIGNLKPKEFKKIEP